MDKHDWLAERFEEKRGHLRGVAYRMRSPGGPREFAVPRPGPGAPSPSRAVPGFAQPALVNGTVGVVVAPRGRLSRVLSLTIDDGKIVEVDVIADPQRLRQLDLAVLGDR